MRQGNKLKILHITSHLNAGGISRYIQLLSYEMARRGHEVAVLSEGGNLRLELEAKGIKTFCLPIKKKSILDPSLYRPIFKIARLARMGKFDIIHAHTRVAQALSFFLRRMTGIPVVSTCHGYFKYNLGRRMFPFWGDKVVAISRPVADDLESLHRLPASRIRVVENAIDFNESLRKVMSQDRASIRRNRGIPENATVVTAIGRLVRDKGHELLLRAAARLLNFFPDIFVLIAGDGKEKDSLTKLIAELNLSGKALIVPDLENISEALAVTDIFVHPAFYREGFGLSIAEAMTALKPVVITDIPAVNKIFRPGECCVMAKPSDIDSLAGAIRFLLEAPAERVRIAQAGHDFIRPLCSVERMGDQMEAVYGELIRPARG